MSSSRSAWMLGAGGMGVGPLAIYLKSEGWDVRGCDDAMGGPMAAQLATAGIPLQASLETGNWTPQIVAHTRERRYAVNCTEVFLNILWFIQFKILVCFKT